MDCHCIPHTQVPNSTRLFTDYLYDFARVSEFYEHYPFQEDSFTKAAQAIHYDPELRRQVVAVLREQNQRMSAPEKTMENLARLEQGNCVAVLTGQQTGLFTGPAFALYKGLTAVKLARSLSERGQPAVPLFWLATEDHDLEEINHCFVADPDGNPHRLAYNVPAPVEHTSVGSIAFSEEILKVIDELRALLPESASGAEMLANLSEFYRPGRTFGEAFGGLLSRLFAEFGVIVVDPMDARLHRLSAGVFRAAIQSAAALTEELIERDRRLAACGYHAQVHVTDNFSLLFVNVNGQRRALRMREGQFVTAQGDSYSADELLAQLERQPETISANVLLRPIMEDALLPTVAYVGGPSELAYFAQAGVIYRHILGRMPVVFPRASMTIQDGAAHRLMGKYGLTLPDIFAGKQALRDKMAARFLPPDLTELFRKTAADIETGVQAIQASLKLLDPTLVDAAATSGRKIHHQLATLEHKASAAVQKHSEQIERDAARLENALFPRKNPQERLYSGIHFLARSGPGFLKEIYEQIHLHSPQHQVIEM